MFSSRHTTRRDAVEMPRPARAAELAAQRRQLHAHGLFETERIDLGRIAARTASRPLPAAATSASSSRERARVRREILARAELRGIHEDAHDDAVRRSARELDEAHVPGMQIAHRRNERDGSRRGRQARSPRGPR